MIVQLPNLNFQLNSKMKVNEIRKLVLFLKNDHVIGVVILEGQIDTPALRDKDVTDIRTPAIHRRIRKKKND